MLLFTLQVDLESYKELKDMILQLSNIILKVIKHSSAQIKRALCLFITVIFVAAQIFLPANFAFAEDPLFSDNSFNRPVASTQALIFLGVPGDVNGDKKVDSGDLQAVRDAGLYETGQPATREQGDLNGDQVVDSSDLVLMFKHFGTDSSTGDSSSQLTTQFLLDDKPLSEPTSDENQEALPELGEPAPKSAKAMELIPIPGDVNGDLKVNSDDLQTVR